MLKGKIYEYMKKYLDAYLYDFDESKLNMSFLSGSIQLQDLHVRQDMANRLIDSFGIPLSLKVGLIQNVNITFSVLSFWTSPLELVIDDIYLVLGPSTFFRSNNDSYIVETGPDLLNATYDSTNAFNVFDHEMKIKANSGGEEQARQSANQADVKAYEHLKMLAQSDILKERLIEEEKQVQNVRLIFKNIHLTISRVHIRYEDDYYHQDLNKKFAFGVTIENLQVRSEQDDWSINNQQRNKQSGQQGHFFRSPIDRQKRYRELAPDSANLLVKEILATQVQIYYDNTGQIIIPTEMLEEAMQQGEPRKVFEKVPVADIKDRMASVFGGGGENPRNPYLVFEHFTVSTHIFSYRSVDFDGLYGMLQGRMAGQIGQNTQANDYMSARDVGRQGRNGSRSGPPSTSSGKSALFRELQEAQFKYFRNEFSIKFALSPAHGHKNIVMNVTPDLLATLQLVNDYIDNYYIAQDLKQYRPQRKPITASMVQGFSKKVLKAESFKRKRRNVVRDWLYFIVWYVRLKRILDQHKSTSLPATPKSLLRGKSDSQGGNASLKSPIQDPTQLTTMSLACGLPPIQLKFFENTQKMEEFYILNAHGNGSRGGAQSRGGRPSAMRIAPIGVNVHDVLLSYSQNMLYQRFERDLRVRSIDVFLSKIKQATDDWDPNEVGQSAHRGRGSRNGQGDRTARASGAPSKDQILQFDSSFTKGSTLNRHNQFSSQNMFNSQKMSTQEFGVSQSFSHGRSRPPQNLAPWDDGDADAAGDYLAYHHQQQDQSIWTTLFNAFKDLFNMNTVFGNGAEELEDDETRKLQDLRRCPSQARNSIHRGGGPIARDPGSPSGSGVKGRVSILQNAQLELTRVNRNETRNDRNQGLAKGYGGDFQRNRQNKTQSFKTPASSDPYHRGGSSGLGQSMRYGSQKEPNWPPQDKTQSYESDGFSRLVATHQCVNADTNQPVEITQYPLIRTDFQSGSDVLVLSMTIEKQSRMHVSCLVDRPLEVTYCAQDILDVLLARDCGLIQSFYSATAGILRQQSIGSTSDNEQFQIIDFKPLWAIRQSLKWQLAKPLRRPPKIPLKKKRQVQNGSDDEGNIDEEEGENIVDEEAERQNTLSYIRCKPSINQSHNSSLMGDMTMADGRSNIKARNNLVNQSQLSLGHGYLSSDGLQRNPRSKQLGPRGSMSAVQRNAENEGGTDKYLQDVLINFDKRMSGELGEQTDAGATIQIEVNIDQPVSVRFLTSEPSTRGLDYQSVCKLRIQPSEYNFIRTPRQTSFSAFGMEFESSNRMRVLQLFAKQMQFSLKNFMDNPILQEHLQGKRVMLRFQELLRIKLYQKKKQNPKNAGISALFGGFNDNENFMSSTQNLQQSFKEIGASSTQKFGPSTFKEPKGNPFSLKGHKPEMKAKKNSILSKIETPGPHDNDSSDSSNSAKRRYQNLEGDDETSPFDQSGNIPVQIKQVSQLNMQIIYNNITGDPEVKQPDNAAAQLKKDNQKDKDKIQKKSAQVA